MKTNYGGWGYLSSEVLQQQYDETQLRAVGLQAARAGLLHSGAKVEIGPKWEQAKETTRELLLALGILIPHEPQPIGEAS